MNAVLWIIGIAATIASGLLFWQYKHQPSENSGFGYMIGAIICALVACGCAFYYFFKKTRDDADQDISITKF